MFETTTKLQSDWDCRKCVQTLSQCRLCVCVKVYHTLVVMMEDTSDYLVGVREHEDY